MSIIFPVIVIGVSTNAVVVSEDVGVVNMTVSLLQGVLLRPLVLQLFTVDGTSTGKLWSTQTHHMCMCVLLVFIVHV